ncbi:MAG: hypothetical protein J0I42_07385 [Bosea sp.]|uniref:hypothetical protein n=1 Tax=Bosea sp. (in: a-proteobacteria) TaxID=1871050 RepID=UPI001AD17C15|nr:hypothetical protein [Bosea sp. (in: a-proteobacteria)]MBN9451760.1 hypothetical protein [Bosea sp. (in: a-proteobacteria)]
MTDEELRALPGYVPPIEEQLDAAKGRRATYYASGYIVIEPRRPEDDLVIILPSRYRR